MNGHLLVVTRALLFHNNIPKQYWGEATLTATFLINWLAFKSLNSQNPIQLLTEAFPEFNASICLTPKVYGCLTFVHFHTPNRGKLDPHALKCVFIVYPSTQKGYKYYHPPTKKFFISTDVYFVDDKPYFSRTYP